MSIAEKLVTVTENQERIYNKGLAEGGEPAFIQMENYMTNYGTRPAYQNAFSRQDWTGYTFRNTVYPIGSAENIFFTYLGTELPKGIDFSRLEPTASLQTAFRYANNLTHIPDLNIPAPTEYKLTFADMNLLEKIDIVRCNENTIFTDTFRNLPKVTDITFEGVIGQNGLKFHQAPLISHDSLMSALNCLQDKTADTSGTVWQVTLGSTNLAKLTTEEIEAVEAKGWVLV